MEAPVLRRAEPRFRCQKSRRDLSLTDPHCANPTSYCRWRTACPVHHLEKAAARLGH